MWRRKLGGREEEDSRLSDLGQEGGTNFASYLQTPREVTKMPVIYINIFS